MAHTFFKQYAGKLNEIPKQNTRIPLSDIGTHCRGALFLDGKDILTPELEKRLATICLPIKGFYFGRFDLKAPSKESLRRGEGIQILELNGLTSESTHIYHPTYTLLNAYKTLIAQWTVAYQIGHANKKRGHMPSSWKEIFRI